MNRIAAIRLTVERLATRDGATATNPISHIAIADALGGKSADWMAQVTDAHYRQ